jgi:succinate-semialdehyde dehydrogenase/glutarate-semialdehyde dehydrogenase
MFTGSTETGRKLATHAASRLIPYNMELGGKNALIVLPDADVNHAATVAIEGTFNNAGQVCINFERAYVHHDIYERFTQELVRQTEALRLGATSDFSADFGSLISQEQLTTVQQHMNDALEKGAQILTGGRHRPDLGPYFYEPTILTDVSSNMKLYAEETFGPVLALHQVETVEDAIRQANDSRYGLHFAVMGGNRKHAEQVAQKLEAGSVCVNDSYMIWAAMDGPMGGVKDSGVGRRHGPDGIRRFTEPQTIITNRTKIQVSSYETALAINQPLADLLAFALKLWRHIPFIR